MTSYPQLQVVDQRCIPARSTRITLFSDEPSSISALVNAMNTAGMKDIASSRLETDDMVHITKSYWAKNWDSIEVIHIVPADEPGIRQDDKVDEISITPHPDTVTEAGNYEYFESQGRNPIAFALAEFVDNSLMASATCKDRKITIEIHTSDKRENDSIFVLDNGVGMDEQDMQDWATYHKSLSRRPNKKFDLELDVPRYLNSNISKFGVGAKQAAFFLADSVRMISKRPGIDDVLEVSLSRSGFEQRSQKGDAYRTDLFHRRPGQLQDHHSSYADIVASESKKSHFTVVVLQDILRRHHGVLCDPSRLVEDLAQVYYYYTHGPKPGAKPLVTIEVQHFHNEKRMETYNLKNVKTDLESRRIETAVKDIFDFEIEVTKDGQRCIVEGQLRYHPYDEDHETYPAHTAEVLDDDDMSDAARDTQHPIFTCYWNGRLVADAVVDSLPFCSPYDRDGKLKKATERIDDMEVYNRLSGTLWLGTPWAVTTNKMTFLQSLKNDLSDPHNGFKAGKRQTTIASDKECLKWIAKCHEKYDRQIQFSEADESICKKKFKEYPEYHHWTRFKRVKTSDTEFKVNQCVKITRKNVVGRIEGFYLAGAHHRETFHSQASVAVVVINIEPKELHPNESLVMSIKQLRPRDNRTYIKRIDEKEFKKAIKEEKLRRPAKIELIFADATGKGSKDNLSGVIKNDDKVDSYHPIGPVQIRLFDNKDHLVQDKKGVFRVDQILEHAKDTGQEYKEVHRYMANWNSQWDYWFKHFTRTEIGRYRLIHRAVWVKGTGDDAEETELCRHVIPYEVTGGTLNRVEAKLGPKFQSKPVRMGDTVPIEFRFFDEFENPLKPKEPFKTCKPTVELEHVSVLKAKASFVDMVGIVNIEVGKPSDMGPDEFPKDGIKDRFKVTFTSYPTQSKRSGQPPAKRAKMDKEPRVVEQYFDVTITTGLPHKVLLADPAKREVTLRNFEPIPFPQVRVLDRFGFPAAPSSSKVEKWCFLVTLQKGAKLIANSNLDGTFPEHPQKLSIRAKHSTFPMHLQLLTAPVTSPKDVTEENYAPVEPLELNLNVLPGNVPDKITLTSDDDNIAKALTLKATPDDQRRKKSTSRKAVYSIQVPVGTTLSDLKFQILSEDSEKVALTSQVLNSATLSWISNIKNKHLKKLEEGILPKIEVPPVIHNVQDAVFSVTFPDQQTTLTLHIEIIPRPLEIDHLECKFLKDSYSYGDIVETDGIAVRLKDKHDNDCKLPDGGKLELAGDIELVNLVQKETVQRHAVAYILNGFKFTGELGPKKVTVSFGKLASTLRTEVGPGPISSVSVAPWQTEDSEWDGTLELVAGQVLCDNLIIRLTDKYGNAVPTSKDDARVIRLVPQAQLNLLYKGQPVNKVAASQLNRRTDRHGAVSFNDFFSIAHDQKPGAYKLSINVGQSETKLKSIRTLTLNISPDPTRPSHITIQAGESTDKLADWPASGQSCMAGSVIAPVIEAQIVNTSGAVLPRRVIDEKGGPILQMCTKTAVLATFKPDAMPNGDSPIVTQETSQSDDIPSTPAASQAVYRFSGVTAPEKCDAYVFKVVYRPPAPSNTVDISSDVFKLSVTPSHASKLALLHNLPSDLRVANERSKDVIFDRLVIGVQDDYNNNIDGVALDKVKLLGKVQPFGTDEGTAAATDKVPRLARPIETTTTRAKAQLPLCALDSNQDGVPSGRYEIKIFFDEEQAEKAGMTIKPLIIPFYFINSSQKTEQITKLLERRKTLEPSVKTKTTELSELKRNLMKAETDVKTADKHLEQHYRHLQQAQALPKEITKETLQSLSKSEEELKRMQAFASEEKRKQTVRANAVAPTATDNDLYGKVGNMALVEDDDVCRMLSWLLQREMDTLVMQTYERAKQEAKNNMRVFPMETARRPRNAWPKPVDQHAQRLGGNYLLNIITFNPTCREVAIRVLDVLVGDVMLFPNMDAAQQYRKIRKGEVRVILTRDGQRIESSGIFGGKGAQAPPIDKLPRVFSKPPSDLVQRIEKAQVGLRQHIELLRKKDEAVETYRQLLEKSRQPEVQSMEKEVNQARDELRNIDQELKQLESQ